MNLDRVVRSEIRHGIPSPSDTFWLKNWSTFLKPLVFVLLSASLLTLSFPNFNLGFLAWFGLVPFLLALKHQGLMSTVVLSFLWGIVFIVGVFYWITVPDGVRFVDFFLMVGYVGLYYSVFGIFFRFVRQGSSPLLFFAAPTAWVFLEYVRAHFFFLELPWALLGHSQYLYLPLIQVASFTGVYGISFLILFSNILLFALIEQRPRLLVPGLAFVGVVGVVLIYGNFVLSQPADGEISIAVVQGNIPQTVKWDHARLNKALTQHLNLTQQAHQVAPARLTVWPETSVPGAHQRTFKTMKTLSTLALDLDTYLIVGTAEREKFGRETPNHDDRFNSALFLSPTHEQVLRYNKIKLLPFGEFLPQDDLLPWPSHYVSEAGNFRAGEEHTVFRLSNSDDSIIPFSVLICWETIFPDLVRTFVRDGARFIVNIANEAPFGVTSAPYQFLSMNIFRAVENRISIVRSANTGISCFIDPYGRILGKVTADSADIFVSGTLTKSIPLAREITFYTKHGDLFLFVCVPLSVALIIFAFRKTNNREEYL